MACRERYDVISLGKYMSGLWKEAALCSQQAGKVGLPPDNLYNAKQPSGEDVILMGKRIKHQLEQEQLHEGWLLMS